MKGTNRSRITFKVNCINYNMLELTLLVKWYSKYGSCNGAFSQYQKNFCSFANIFLYISLKLGKKIKKILKQHTKLGVQRIDFFFFFDAQKYCLPFFKVFVNGYIHNVVSTSINFVKLDVENNNVVLSCLTLLI